jgi:hypothetical protein
VFGNAVALASFANMASTLVIDSVGDILLNAVDWPVFDIAAAAISYPFRYSDNEWTDLGALTVAQYPDPGLQLQKWARGFVRSNPTDTLSLLKDLNTGVAQRVQYESREVEGTQSPDTLTAGGARAVTSQCCLPKPRDNSASAPGPSPATYTIRTTTSLVRPKVARPTPGPRCSYRARVGSPSTRPTAASAVEI